MKILIFGGNRFVGKIVTKKLFLDGHTVTVLNRSGTSPVDCNIIKCDRNNEINLRDSIGNESYDCVIDMCLYNVDQAIKTVNILKNKVHKYIFISSIAVYNKCDIFPIYETNNIGNNTEFDCYGIDKANIEKYFDTINNFPYINIRPSYILGKNNHVYREKYFFDNILNGLPIEIESNGDAVLSFIFSEDMANIIFKLITSNTMVRTSFNVCSDEYISIKGFANLIGKITNRDVQYKLVDKSNFFKNYHCIISNQKIKDVIGEYNFKSLEKGLTEFYEHTY